MASYDSFFKYINFFIIYVIACSIMDIQNLEFLGIGLSILISIITNMFLFIDIISSPKSNDIVVAFLIIGIISLFISIVLFLMMIVKLHYKYSAKGSPIRFTRYSREKVNLFKTLFITNNILIWVIAFLYFSLYKIDLKKPYNQMSSDQILQNYFKKMNIDKNEMYVPFYNTKYTMPGEQIFLLFKVILTCGMLGISGYMIYLSLELSKLDANRIYVPDHEDETIPKTVPKKPFMSGNFDVFQNLNLNYIMNSRTMLNI